MKFSLPLYSILGLRTSQHGLTYPFLIPDFAPNTHKYKIEKDTKTYLWVIVPLSLWYTQRFFFYPQGSVS